ncbi:hypothetical protein [Marmoricola sp. RAF53]|uniref:hypothetical protein n=1 Tax=Marmoricola sp. RAF53 TaxID=3233059 RepID=UPI003F971831
MWLRGAPGALAALGFLTFLGAVVLVAGPPWSGSWKMALDQATGVVLLVGPGAAAIAAWTYARMTGAQWPRQLAGVERGLRGWLSPVGCVLAVALAGLLLCVLAATTIASATGALASPGSLAMLVQPVAALGCEVVLGAVFGTYVRDWIAVPLAAVTSFLLAVVSVDGILPGLFRTGGVTGPLAGERFVLPTLYLQAAVLAAIGVALLTVLIRPATATSAVRHVLPVAAATTLAALGMTQLWSHGYTRYEAEPGGPRLACRGSAPQVCTSRDTTRPLGDLVAKLGKFSGPITAAGATLPERFVQDLPGRVPDRDGVVILVGSEPVSSTVSTGSAVLALATPRGCPAFSAERPPEQALQVRAVLADWIAVRNRLPGIAVDPASPEGRWFSTPAEEQQRWVARTYAQLRACDLTNLRLPFSP